MIKTVFPNGLFNPPATEAEIRLVEGELNVRLPEQLRQLYLETNGFREESGNASYLFSLTANAGSSLLDVTLCMWQEFDVPDLSPFVFFGNNAYEAWGIDWKNGNKIVAYHHDMESEYRTVGSNILDVYTTEHRRLLESVKAAEPFLLREASAPSRQLEFAIEINGLDFKCSRLITGAERLNQEITVQGIGSARDPATYTCDNRYGDPTMTSMLMTAQKIASKIVLGSGT